MANIPKVGQFGHVYKRNIVKTVEQLSHYPGDGSLKLWKAMTWLVGVPAIILASINCYLKHEEHNIERPEFIHYEYMKIMRKPFPWGDGKHSLFHNPKKNYIPGIGYEA